MASLDPVYILKLLDASTLFSESKKEAIKKKLPTLSGLKVAELVQILEKEQKVVARHHRKIGEIKVKASQDKVKAIYDFAEQKINEEEEGIIKDLDAELEAL